MMRRLRACVKTVPLALAAVLATALFCGPLWAAPSGLDPGADADPTVYMVSVETSIQMIEENAGSADFVLLDVRTAEEFRSTHLKDARNLDYYSPVFENGIDLLDPGKTYLIYCRTQNRSQKTAVMMEAKGFREFYYMYGGITEWSAKNYPTVSGFVTVAADGFESRKFNGGTGWLDPWIKTGNVARLKKDPYEGRFYVKLMGGDKAGLLERNLDLSGYTSARLRFAGRIKSLEKEDKALVKVSQDGVTETTVMELTPAHSDDQWHLYAIDVPLAGLSADFRIIFEAAMNKKKTDAWFLDDIVVEASTQTPGEPVVLDVFSEGLGSVALDPPGQSYDPGTMVTLSATAEPGWAFHHWEGDIGGDVNPAMISMDSDKIITAVFIDTTTFALQVSTLGQGGVTLDPDGGVYSVGTAVTLTAEGGTGWIFSHWVGDLTGSQNPATLIMNADMNVEAVFIEGTPPAAPTITSIPVVTFKTLPIIINGRNFDTSLSRVFVEGNGVAHWAKVLTRKARRITIENPDYINGVYQVTVYNGNLGSNTMEMFIDCG